MTACVSVPDRAQLINSFGDSTPVSHVCHSKPQAKAQPKSLINNEFSLVSWNIHKLDDAGWQDDLTTLGQEMDVLLLQEAYLQPGLERWLEETRLMWDMSPAFEYKTIPTGVLTAGKAQSDVNCSLIRHEPNIYLPKAALISFYPMNENKQLLLVANIHGINFTTDTLDLAQQLAEVKEIINHHTGPVILAGDFNTWSQARMNTLEKMTRDLDLSPVEFDGQQPATHMGRVVDHIYFRGLQAVNSEVMPVKSSDHHPLKVRFVLNEYPVYEN
jgi:endonuclease/exonuclease/phosphatase (EEP) superfamily protein YafD